MRRDALPEIEGWFPERGGGSAPWGTRSGEEESLHSEEAVPA